MTKECKRCGWCCEHVMIKIKPIIAFRITDKDREWMKTRGIDIIKWHDGTCQMVVPSICDHLIFESIQNSPDLRAVCMLQDGGKPAICKENGCPLP